MCLLVSQVQSAETELRVLRDSGIRGGLVVVVGCTDTGFLTELASREGHLVHGIDTDQGLVDVATAELKARDLLGRASVARFDGVHLPYVDNLVNLLVIQDPAGQIKDREILRVLAPGGVGLLEGRRIVKEVPPELDAWTHHMYDASGIGAGQDTAVSRPRSIQWKAGPEYSRSHENMSSVSAVVSAEGRVFSIMDEGPATSIYLPPAWFLTARDAFSGVQLWKIPIAQWHARLFPLKSGPLQLPRRLVAVEDRVYVTLGIDAPVSELEAATGEVLRTFAGTEHAEEILFLNGKLLVVVHTDSATVPFRGSTPASRRGLAIDEQVVNLAGSRSVVMIDSATGKTVWKTDPAPVIPLTIAADGTRTFFLRGAEIVAVNSESGQDIWTDAVSTKHVRFGTASSPTLLVHKDTVYLGKDGELTARDAATGESLWSAPCATGGYRAPASIFIVGDLIWDVAAGGEPYRPGSDPNKINRFFTGYDLRTGQVQKRLPISGQQGYAIMHHRCHVPRASGNSIITSFPGIEFFDVDTGQSTHDSWLRGACLYGFMPANGLIYTPPHPCACYTQGKLTGYWAVAGGRSRPEPVTPVERLEKGPAYDVIVSRYPRPQSPHDWSTYRGDAGRRGASLTSIASDVQELWGSDVGANLSPCVVAAGKLFVSTTEDGTIHALDAGTGEPLWQFAAGGRVDSPPTYYDGTVIFGSRDGYVYCLRADDGALVWRFLAAPMDQRCVVYDQVESVWPVHGSVLITNDVLWFTAGRSSFLDDGLLVYRLDPRTGNVLSATPVSSLDEDDQQPAITSTILTRLDMEGAKNDVLLCDGENVFMRHWAFDLKGNSVEQSMDHLFAPTGFLDTSWFRRTYWIYGRSYVSGAQGWSLVGNSRPSGRIMSIDNDRLYGFGRNQYPGSPGPRHQMYLAGESEHFFAMERDARPEDLGSDAPTLTRGKREKGNTNVLWSTPGDLQVRGMVLCGEVKNKRLVVVGAKGDWVTSSDAFEGKQGSVLRILSVEDGSTIAQYDLPGLPVFDGLVAAHGLLYVSLVDGRVVCLGPGIE